MWKFTAVILAHEVMGGSTTNTEWVPVKVDELAAGERLRYPVYLDHNTLYASEGTAVRESTKKALRDAGVDQLFVQRRDVWKLAKRPESEVGYDRKQIDALIDSGGLFVANSERALRESRAVIGCKLYDPKRRQQLMREHDKTCQLLDDSLRRALNGENVSGAEIVSAVARYLPVLTADCDQVMAVADEVRRDEKLADRCLQMALLGMAIGIEMGMDAGNVRTIGTCGLVHDWGMVKVPDEIRNARKLLSHDEFYEIHKHPYYTYELLQRVEGIGKIVPLVCYQVHEKPNGEGYPYGRKGTSIHLFARILNVADAYIGLTSEQPYRPALLKYSAMELLVRSAGRRSFDADVVRAILHVLSLFPIGSYVTLTDGSIARVLRSQGQRYSTPIVEQLQDSNGNPPRDIVIIDLSTADMGVKAALPTPGRKELALDPEIVHRPRA